MSTPADLAILGDPRKGMFTHLVLVDGKPLPGRWTFKHVGYGEHGYSDLDTGNWVPASSVLLARRTGPPRGRDV